MMEGQRNVDEGRNGPQHWICKFCGCKTNSQVVGNCSICGLSNLERHSRKRSGRKLKHGERTSNVENLSVETKNDPFVDLSLDWEENWHEAIEWCRQRLIKEKSTRNVTKKIIVDSIEGLELVKTTKLLPKILRRGGESVFLKPGNFLQRAVSTLKADEKIADSPESLFGFQISCSDVLPDDSKSWLLKVEGQKDTVQVFLSIVKLWFENAISVFNYNILLANGIEICFDLDSSQAIGAPLKEIAFENEKSGLMIINKKRKQGQLARILGPRAMAFGVAVIQFDGLCCQTITDFKDRKKRAAELGNKISLTVCLSPDADLSALKRSALKYPPRCRDGLPIPIEQAPASSDCYMAALYFSKKYKNVASIEYVDSGSGITSKFAIGRMWNRHKKLFGSKCDDNCECVFQIPLLTESVVRHKFKKHDEKWENPLNLGIDDYPVGFASNFTRKFLTKLKMEYPHENPQQLLNRLIGMWQVHTRTLIFGLDCKDECGCAEGWDLIFHRGHNSIKPKANKSKKRNLQRPVGVLTSKEKMRAKINSRESGDQFQNDGEDMMQQNPNHLDNVAEKKDVLESSSLPRKKQKKASNSFAQKPEGRFPSISLRREYDVVFDVRQPLGFYCQTRTSASDGKTFCMVESIDSRSQCGKDLRIQRGTKILAVSIGSDRYPIKGHKELKLKYIKAQKEGSELRLWFINTQVTAPFELEQKDWMDGFYCGKLTKGWSGGAPSPLLGNKIKSVDKRSAIAKSHQNNSSEQKKLPSVQPGDNWVMFDAMPSIKDSKPKPILKSETRIKRERAPKLQFAVLIEERMYIKESCTNEFLVKPAGVSVV